ncbi:haloacid dehalogenase [Enterococcus florum]|uniref:Haloacid dehalogenase n=1 Tax=Enterococcus florum TaxID=2480627 RepID=A0A4P5P9S1_9ENTE|nr:HAD family hydrolase [Enterococcus florum]GCF92728.1 haloacid dehalogenase [Enterococcus florum]
MEKKLFVFDLDGTLLTSNNQILPSTIVALDYLKRDHTIMLATGRSRFLIQDYLDQLSIKDYIVCNGSAAFLNDQQVYKNTLDKDKLASLLEYFHDQKIDIALTGLDNFCRISSFRVEKMEQAMRSIGGLIPEYQPQFYQENDIYQGLAFYDATNDQLFEKEYPEFRFVRWHQLFVDIVPNQGSKAVTLHEVAAELGISKKNIIAFGDENNDIEMLQEAGIGIAMGNANNSVKAVADFITRTNDDDGIVYAMEKLNLLQQKN